MATQKPVARRNDAGEWVVPSRVQLEFSHAEAATAMAVKYGLPKPRLGASLLPGALHDYAVMRLAVEGEVVAPQPVVDLWLARLVELEVFPDPSE